MTLAFTCEYYFSIEVVIIRKEPTKKRLDFKTQLYSLVGSLEDILSGQYDGKRHEKVINRLEVQFDAAAAAVHAFNNVCAEI